MEVGGTVVADSRQPTMLFETSLPRRHYLPKLDVRMDLLEPTPTPACPYKGEAGYCTSTSREPSTRTWPGATAPVRESAPIAGLVSFYDEKVDVEVDGVAAGASPHPLQLTATDARDGCHVDSFTTLP